MTRALLVLGLCLSATACASSGGAGNPSHTSTPGSAAEAPGAAPVAGRVDPNAPRSRTHVGGTSAGHGSMAAPGVHGATAAEQVMRERAGQAANSTVTGEREVVHEPGQSYAQTRPELIERPAALSNCVIAFTKSLPAAAGRIELRLQLSDEGGVTSSEIALSVKGDSDEATEAQLRACIDAAVPAYRFAPLRPTDARELVEVLEFQPG